MSNSRILIVDQTGQLGGGELSLLDFARHRRKDCDVLLFSDGPFRERLEQAGVSVAVEQGANDVLAISREQGLWSSLRVVPNLANLVWAVAMKSRRSNLLYANSQKALVVCALASVIGRRPLIWHLHDILTASHFSAAMRAIAIRLANWRASCVIANSQATADAFAAAGGRRRAVVIHNGIDPAPFSNVDAEAAGTELRRQIGCGDSPLVGVFSRLAFWKGQHIAIEAARSTPDVHVVLVGGPLFDEQAYEDKLRREADNAEVRGRIHFLGFRNDIPALMSAVDIVIHTSIAPEPFGRVIVEGMLAQKPVIATAAGGALEIIEDGVSGLLVQPGDAGALAAAMRAILASPNERADLACRGYESALRKFSLEACLAATDEVVDVTAGKSARRRFS
ncbi:glycosyltransferase [Methylosinus sp. H3A]|uniref:glycosyltransferase n=1 Tax=Methylosinus sp. H3A TaxID=2785786 RepID=UPI0018C2F9E7|nr:glycosyltransferase [Methylosinus sp. H3A]MBG0811253.1 glycosyltransferase [Methylosinus sp. H3A]